MTDTEALRNKISEAGLKLSYVAERIGLTYQGFWKKLNNHSEFKANEIQALSELLKIRTQEKEKIFFAGKK